MTSPVIAAMKEASASGEIVGVAMVCSLSRSWGFTREVWWWLAVIAACIPLYLQGLDHPGGGFPFVDVLDHEVRGLSPTCEEQWMDWGAGADELGG